MRRIVVLAILTVLLATLLNLAIALGFWWFGERPPPFDPSTFDPEVVDSRPLDLAVWRKRRGPDWPEAPEEATENRYLGITFRSMVWVHIEWSDSPDDVDSKITKQDNYSIDIVELGWPLRCIAGERWNEYHGQPGPYQSSSGMFVAFGAYWPNRVLWSGIVINELFYVSLIVSAYCTWRYGRRWICRRRGRCPQCAYDLRGELSSGCPECGWNRADAHNAGGYSSAASSK